MLNTSAVLAAIEKHPELIAGTIINAAGKCCTLGAMLRALGLSAGEVRAHSRGCPLTDTQRAEFESRYGFDLVGDRATLVDLFDVNDGTGELGKAYALRSKFPKGRVQKYLLDRQFFATV